MSEIALARIEPGVFVIKEEIFSFDIFFIFFKFDLPSVAVQFVVFSCTMFPLYPISHSHVPCVTSFYSLWKIDAAPLAAATLLATYWVDICSLESVSLGDGRHKSATIVIQENRAILRSFHLLLQNPYLYKSRAILRPFHKLLHNPYKNRAIFRSFHKLFTTHIRTEPSYGRFSNFFTNHILRTTGQVLQYRYLLLLYLEQF